MCSKLGRKLHKRWYVQHKLYICIQCTLDHKDMFDSEVTGGYYEN